MLCFILKQNRHFKQNIFSNSSLQFQNWSFYTSKVRNSLLELNSQCWNYLLKEVGIEPQFLASPSRRGLKSIPDFISKVKELTSSYSCQFLPFLEGNSGIGNWCPKWIPHFRSVKWWIPELKWGIEKNVLLKVSINTLTLFFKWKLMHFFYLCAKLRRQS